MVFHFLSRSSSPARNFMNGWRNCKSLPANRPWRLMIQENAAKSHHIQLSSAPNPYSSSYATHSRFFSARSLKESDHHTKKRQAKALWKSFLCGFLTFGPTTYLINEASGSEEIVKPVSFQDLRKLLDAGHVDQIFVAGSLAIVYVRKSGIEHKWIQPIPIVQYVPLESRCMIDIESPESFTEKLERAQAALGIPRSSYVPVTYFDGKNEESLVL